MADDDLDRLARMFRHFADREFHGSSPRYELLARLIAERPALAAPLLAAPAPQRRAILYFAAVQYLLRTGVAGHPLWEYLPTLGGGRAPDDGLPSAFVDFVTWYAAELGALCASRTTQTNEARRCALLRPGFGLAARFAGDRQLSLVELGTSAGLLLLPDRYAYRYTHGPRQRRYGPPGAIELPCEVRGERFPEPAGYPIEVGDRTGIDVAPLDPADPDAVAWLRSCVWPEHVERVARLDTALALAAAVRPRLVTGDLVDALPAVLSTVDDLAVPCVFSSNALAYPPAADLRRLVDVLASVGARRDLVVLLNEAAQVGADLFVTDRPAEAWPPGVLAVGLLTIVTWRAGRPSVEVLARTGPRGEWLEWAPASYPYAPAHSTVPS